MAGRYADYDRFAWIYNQHWGGFSQLVMPILDALVLADLPKDARVLDVACGTGHVSSQLEARGYRVTGLDGSEQMLRYARENAPLSQFLLEDARSFHLPPKFDAAVSTFDSLNHILELPEMEAAFRNIFASLKPGGRFAFDLNLEPGYIAGWNGTTGDALEDHAYIWKNSYEPEQKLARFDATLFRLEEGQWQRSDVTLWQRAYEVADILSSLERAGFTAPRCYQISEDLDLVPVNPEARRGFFACHKPS
jgi:SAM-dependent methyltransferase